MAGERTIGGRIKELREARGLSVRAVAEAMAVTEQNVRAWEGDQWQPRGRAKVQKLDDLLAADGELVEALGYRPDDTALAERVDRLETTVAELLDVLKEIRQRSPGKKPGAR